MTYVPQGEDAQEGGEEEEESMREGEENSPTQTFLTSQTTSYSKTPSPPY